MKNLLVGLIMFMLSLTANSKTIVVYVPFSAGGPTDVLWRFIKPELNNILKENNIQLVTENLVGAGGVIAANKIASTNSEIALGFFSPALVIAPVINPASIKYSADSIKLIGYSGSTKMVVLSNLSEKDFYKKCSEGNITFGSSGIGSTSHLLGKTVVKNLNCKNSTHVPYKGLANAYTDLLGNRIDFLVDFRFSSSNIVTNGKIFEIFVLEDKFLTSLSNWHILISNNNDNDIFKIIESAFKKLKNNKNFVDSIENKFQITDFSRNKNNVWLKQEFDTYKKFIEIE
jgi:tripartite-type tricarboxylate transporter receptor subunit TctC